MFGYIFFLLSINRFLKQTEISACFYFSFFVVLMRRAPLHYAQADLVIDKAVVMGGPSCRRGGMLVKKL